MPKSQQPELGEQMVCKQIRPGAVVLDIGAGDGKWGKLLRERARIIHAVEVFPANAQKCREAVVYDEVFECDIRDFAEDTNRYTTAILGDVLEHLPHHDALKLLDRLRGSVSEIFLIIPINVVHQDGDYWGNPYETHLYHWSDYELRMKQGFTLLNIGVNENGLVAIGAYVWRQR
jgi:predicted TPR repeat methyltransferase